MSKVMTPSVYTDSHAGAIPAPPLRHARDAAAARDDSGAPAGLCAVCTRGPVKLFNLGSCRPRVSCHDARYNDLAKWNSSGLCRDATIPRDTLVGSWRRSLQLREYPSRAPANPHRIGRAGCLENHRPKDGICTTGVLPQFTLRRHISSWRADSCA
jgi:hypothetical protein